MITISKPKLLAALSLMIILATPISVSAVSTTKVLPTNTIWADDFESYTTTPSISNWFSTDNCGAATPSFANLSINTTYFLAGGKALEIAAPGAACTQDARHTLASSSNLVGFSGWFQYNCNMFTVGSGEDIGVSLEYNAPLAGWGAAGGNNQKWEFRLVFVPSTHLWKYKTGGSLFNIVVSDSKNFQSSCWDSNASFPSFRNEWQYFSIIGNRLTGTYVSISTVQGVFTCANGGLNNGCTANDEAADSFNSNPPAPTVWGVEAQLDSGGSPSSPSYYAFALDDVLITDETLGNPPIIQFGITLFSAWFPILVTSIAMLYTTSGIGLIRRVWFNKTEGILSSYRTIVATGVIATIGFIVILVIGALLTQQVCSSLPPGTATCSY